MGLRGRYSCERRIQLDGHRAGIVGRVARREMVWIHSRHELAVLTWSGGPGDGPAIRIEGDAHKNLVCGDACLQVAINGKGDVENRVGVKLGLHSGDTKPVKGLKGP